MLSSPQLLVAAWAGADLIDRARAAAADPEKRACRRVMTADGDLDVNGSSCDGLSNKGPERLHCRPCDVNATVGANVRAITSTYRANGCKILLEAKFEPSPIFILKAFSFPVYFLLLRDNVIVITHLFNMLL